MRLSICAMSVSVVHYEGPLASSLEKGALNGGFASVGTAHHLPQFGPDAGVL